VIKKKTPGKPDKKLSEKKERLVAFIREVFIQRAAQIAKTEKAEDMLKMILRSNDGESSGSDSKEFWKLLDKVRKEVLGGAEKQPTSGSGKRKTSERAPRKVKGK